MKRSALLALLAVALPAAASTSTSSVTTVTYRINSTTMGTHFGGTYEAAIGQAIESLATAGAPKKFLYGGDTTVDECSDNPTDNVISAAFCGNLSCTLPSKLTVCGNGKWIIELYEDAGYAWSEFDSTGTYLEYGPAVASVLARHYAGTSVTYGISNADSPSELTGLRNAVYSDEQHYLGHARRYMHYRSSSLADFGSISASATSLLLGVGGHTAILNTTGTRLWYVNPVAQTYHSPIEANTGDGSVANTSISSLSDQTSHLHSFLAHDPSTGCTALSTHATAGGTLIIYTVGSSSWSSPWIHSASESGLRYGLPLAATREWDYRYNPSTFSWAEAEVSSFVGVRVDLPSGNVYVSKYLVGSDCSGSPSNTDGDGTEVQLYGGATGGSFSGLTAVKASGPATVACEAQTSSSTGYSCSVVYPSTASSRELQEVRFRMKLTSTGVALYSSTPSAMGLTTYSQPNMSGPRSGSGKFVLAVKKTDGTIGYKMKTGISGTWSSWDNVNEYTHFAPMPTYEATNGEYQLVSDTDACPGQLEPASGTGACQCPAGYQRSGFNCQAL